MPGITLIDKIVPQGSFTGMVDAEQVLGGGESGTLPDTTIALSNVTQFMASGDFGESGGEVTLVDLTVPHFAATSIVTATETIGSNNVETMLPTSAAVKAYVDSQVDTADTLTELNDTTIDASPEDNEILAYNTATGKWLNQTPAEAGFATSATTDTTDASNISSGTLSNDRLPASIDITNDITLGGDLKGPASFIIDPAAHGDNTGTVVVAGNLQVDGTTTTINSTTMTVDDKDLILAAGAANSAAADGAGISIDGAGASLIYEHDTTSWEMNKPLNVSGVVTMGEGSSLATNAAPTADVDIANKKYVDDQDAAIASDVLIFTNKTFDVDATGNSISNIDVADFKAAAIVTEGEGLSSNDNDTSLPTSAAVIDYVNNTGGVREIDDLGDVNITDYSAGSLLIGDGDSYDQLKIIGDGAISVTAQNQLDDEATLEVYKVRHSSESDPLFEWTTPGNGQWKITTKTKLPNGGTWQQIPVVGLYELGGVGVTPNNENDLGSGMGSLCWNEDDENLFISLPESAGS